MNRGKQTCRILKEIRRQIAEANDIEFIVSECTYQGDCQGTCPKCEAEVRYLEQQLEQKEANGKTTLRCGISDVNSEQNSEENSNSDTPEAPDTIETTLEGDLIIDDEEQWTTIGIMIDDELYKE